MFINHRFYLMDWTNDHLTIDRVIYRAIVIRFVLIESHLLCLLSPNTYPSDFMWLNGSHCIKRNREENILHIIAHQLCSL